MTIRPVFERIGISWFRVGRSSWSVVALIFPPAHREAG